MEVAELLETAKKHLPHSHSGKVRESFRLKRLGKRKLRLVIATDCRSIFDFKLGFPVKNVGQVLNATNIYYRRKMTERGIAHDLVAFGTEIDKYLPVELRNIPELWKRAVVVEELDMIPVEVVFRKYLTGTGITQYNETGMLSGQVLPKGLINGSLLPALIPNPTTKAEEGHDIPILVEEAESYYSGLITVQGLELAGFLDEDVERGGEFMFVDSKWEIGIDPITGEAKVADEFGTSDSSRFWRKKEYEEKWPQKLPSPFDKQLIRNRGIELGFNSLDPKNPEHQAMVRAWRPTREELYAFELRNYEFFYKSKHMTYMDFQEVVMGIPRRYI